MEFEVHNQGFSLDKDWLRDELFKIRFQDSYTVPSTIVHSASPETRFKARAAWFVNLASVLEIAIDMGFIERPSAQLDVSSFLNWYAHRSDYPNTEGGNEILYVARHIEKGDEIIDKVLESVPVEALELGKLE